jgi:hypothetical protein
MLFVVVDATLEDRETTVGEVASLLGVTGREVLGTLVELNHLFSTGGASPWAMVPQVAPGASPSDMDLRILEMTDDLARRIDLVRGGLLDAAEARSPA